MKTSRRKFLEYSLKYYRTPTSKINQKLKKGETILATSSTGNVTLFYRSTTRGKLEFLEEKEFFEQSSVNSKMRQQDRRNADNDPFVLFVQNYKLEKGCANSACLCRALNFAHHLYDFDHIDKSKKENNICKLMMRYKEAYGKEAKERYKNQILQEMENCQVLCVVCHRDKTYEERYGDHIKLRNFENKEQYFIERNISPEPKYFLPLEDFVISSL